MSSWEKWTSSGEMISMIWAVHFDALQSRDSIKEIVSSCEIGTGAFLAASPSAPFLEALLLVFFLPALVEEPPFSIATDRSGVRKSLGFSWVPLPARHWRCRASHL
mmetsp:Transcript_55838/g.103343  ORF Transcript_55838/g.103343 Transcript_55838/m.103343 type:complete len:106 (-) Transcript_55838:6-323(-)